MYCPCHPGAFVTEVTTLVHCLLVNDLKVLLFKESEEFKQELVGLRQATLLFVTAPGILSQKKLTSPYSCV